MSLPLPPPNFRFDRNSRPKDFGLIAWLEETRIVLPLKAIDIAFEVRGDLVDVTLDQVFHQKNRKPLDVTYTFPLPADAAVYRCELIVNGNVIAARVEEEAKAKEIAEAMKAAGRRTSLVEMNRDNLFTLELGNVQPDDLIVVRFAWFQLIDHATDTNSFLIPFTPGLRYIPGNPLLRSNRGAGVLDDTDLVPDGSKISPPRIDQLHPDAARVSLRGKMDSRLLETLSVSSPSHPLLLREKSDLLELTLSQGADLPDRDFVLQWKEKPASSALELTSLSCTDEQHHYAVVRLDAPNEAPVAAAQNRDYYFLVDRSGSMEGKKWAAASQALQNFVKELDATDRVWITLFESRYQDFSEAPISVAALVHNKAFSDLVKVGVTGGTELYPALEHVLAQISVHSKERNPVLILLTDGQVGNEASTLKLLKGHDSLSLHTFGIDTTVNEGFLKKLAAQQRGACILLTPNDDIAAAVARLGHRLRRPVLTQISVPKDWETSLRHLPDLCAGEHLLLALRGPKTATHLTLTGRRTDETLQEFSFELTPQPLAAPRLLWAKQSIDRLLAAEKKTDAVALAIKHNILCQGAAFIAFDTKKKVKISKQGLYQPSLTPKPITHYQRPAASPISHIPECSPFTSARELTAEQKQALADDKKACDTFIQKFKDNHFATLAQIVGQEKASTGDNRKNLRDIIQNFVTERLKEESTSVDRTHAFNLCSELQEILVPTPLTRPSPPHPLLDVEDGRNVSRAVWNRLYHHFGKTVLCYPEGYLTIEEWKEAANRFEIFQDALGQVIRNLLRIWATREYPLRFPLLDQLLLDLNVEMNPHGLLEKFIHLHITEPDIAQDLLSLLALKKNKTQLQFL